MTASATGSGPDESPYRILTLHTAAQRRQAAELYRSVFGYDHPSYGINPRLLAGLSANGGSAVGAIDRHDRLVGFAYGFLGTDGSRSYHYSQAAVVAAGLQGKGLGRRLKLAQRDVALRTGTTAMRWTYDPLLTRNAHFNLDVLGARGIRFSPDMYDEPGTDRIVVEWDLTRDPAVRPEPEELPASLWEPGAGSSPGSSPGSPAASWGHRIDDGDRAVLSLPSDIGRLRATEPDHAAALADTARQTLIGLFDDGYRAVSCRVVAPHTACYLFRRPSDSLETGRKVGQ